MGRSGCTADGLALKQERQPERLRRRYTLSMMRAKFPTVQESSQNLGSEKLDWALWRWAGMESTSVSTSVSIYMQIRKYRRNCVHTRMYLFSTQRLQ